MCYRGHWHAVEAMSAGVNNACEDRGAFGGLSVHSMELHCVNVLEIDSMLFQLIK